MCGIFGIVAQTKVNPEPFTDALNRLAQAIKAGKSHQDVVNYSRMHNRHNRT